jgi:NADPH:quinone reductase-like Zn-dependent oxidoreductase
MKAIEVRRLGGPEVLTLVEIPIPQPKPHEALIKIKVSGVLSMIAGGKLKIRISKTYPLEAVQQAHRDLESRNTSGKLLLLPN